MIVIALLVVVGLGLLPAVALTRSWTLGLSISGPISVVLCSLGVSIGTMTRTPPVAWCWLALAAANVGACAAILRRRAEAIVLGGPVSAVALTAVPLGFLALFPPAPLGWDSRSIWWFRASWILDGSGAVRDGLTNASIQWSHPTYPAGVPGFVATIWSVTGGENLVLAQHLTTVLTTLAFTALALVLTSTKTASSSTSWIRLGAVLVMTASAAHLAQGSGATGYVDVLAAGYVTVSIAAPLCFTDARSARVVGAVTLAAALATKNESLYFGLLALPIALALTPHARRPQAGAYAIAALPFVLWQATLAVAGAPSDSTFDRSTAMRRVVSSEGMSRLRVAARAVLDTVGPVVGAACLAVAFVLLAIGPAEWRAIRTALGLSAAAVVTAASMPLIYMTGEPEIGWWLTTSLDRVSTISSVCALAAMVALVPTIIEVLPRHAGHDGSPNARDVDSAALEAGA